jgi:hypothetical protein
VLDEGDAQAAIQLMVVSQSVRGLDAAARRLLFIHRPNGRWLLLRPIRPQKAVLAAARPRWTSRSVVLITVDSSRF